MGLQDVEARSLGVHDEAEEPGLAEDGVEHCYAAAAVEQVAREPVHLDLRHGSVCRLGGRNQPVYCGGVLSSSVEARDASERHHIEARRVWHLGERVGHRGVCLDDTSHPIQHVCLDHEGSRRLLRQIATARPRMLGGILQLGERGGHESPLRRELHRLRPGSTEAGQVVSRAAVPSRTGTKELAVQRLKGGHLDEAVVCQADE